MRFVCVLGLAMTGIMLPWPSSALPDSDVQIEYFANRRMGGEPVGRKMLTCQGRRIVTGQATPYFRRVQAKCESRGPAPEEPIRCEFTKRGCNDRLPGVDPRR